jgi:hypothetical protein
LRWKKKNGQTCYGVIISTLEPRDVILLTKQPVDRVSDKRALMGAYGAFYDQRGGTVEIEIKEDKQGVGMTKRSKKRFEAQQMVVLLNSLAHNFIAISRVKSLGGLPSVRMGSGTVSFSSVAKSSLSEAARCSATSFKISCSTLDCAYAEPAQTESKVRTTRNRFIQENPFDFVVLIRRASVG